MRLFEWHSSSFKEHEKKLPEFVNYLSGVWKNRNRHYEAAEQLTEEEQQERKIQKQRFFDFTIDGKISARNYVGVVQYDGIRVEVYPKIFAHDKSENTGKWQLNVLYWLSYCRKIRFPYSFADVSKLKFDDYLELLIYLFANYTVDLVSLQPFQTYQVVEEETAYLKGRLLFDNYTKHNLTTGRWQNFFCAYEPFVYDNLFNRIIKYVSRRLLMISRNGLNREKLNEIIFLLDGVSDLRCTADDCDKVKLNPLFDDHRQILALCKLYMSNQVIDMDSEDSKNFCFLIPMEYVFEDFLYGFISDKWPSLNVQSQSTAYLALNQRVPVFQMKNDIYLANRLIIDAKYKVRGSTEDGKAGVNQNDLYQMVSYAIKRNCKDVLLVYPDIELALAGPAVFQVDSAMFPEPLIINIYSLNIVIDEIAGADELMKDRIVRMNGIFAGDV